MSVPLARMSANSRTQHRALVAAFNSVSVEKSRALLLPPAARMVCVSAMPCWLCFAAPAEQTHPLHEWLLRTSRLFLSVSRMTCRCARQCTTCLATGIGREYLPVIAAASTKLIMLALPLSGSSFKFDATTIPADTCEQL